MKTENKCIVWIEDDIDVIDPVVDPLRKSGFNILPLRNYTEAKDHLEEIRNCDLILIDLILPPGREEQENDQEYLGLKLLKFLRHEEIQIPVIAFSVVADEPNLEEELRQLNAVPLSKPVRPSELKNEVFFILGYSE